MISRTICREVKIKANKRIWPWNNRTPIWCRICRVHRLISACDTQLSSRLNSDYSGYVTMQKCDGTCSKCLCCIGVYLKTYVHFIYVLTTGICPMQFSSDYTEGPKRHISCAEARTHAPLSTSNCSNAIPQSLTVSFPYGRLNSALCGLWNSCLNSFLNQLSS